MMETATNGDAEPYIIISGPRPTAPIEIVIQHLFSLAVATICPPNHHHGAIVRPFKSRHVVAVAAALPIPRSDKTLSADRRIDRLVARQFAIITWPTTTGSNTFGNADGRWLDNAFLELNGFISPTSARAQTNREMR